MSAMSRPRTSSSARPSTSPGEEPSHAYDRSSDRSWPIAAAARRSCPTTSPTARPMAPSGSGSTSNQSPPTSALPAGRDVRGRDVEAGDLRDLGQQAALQGQGGGALGEEQPDVVERQPRAAPRCAAVTTASAVKPSTATRASTPSTRSRARSGTTIALPRPSRRSRSSCTGVVRAGQAGHVDRVRRRDEAGAAGQRLGDLGRPRQPADVLVRQRACRLPVVRVGDDQVDAVEPAAVVGHRDEAPGGQRRDGDVAEGVHRVVVLQVPRQLVADPGQQVQPGRRLVGHVDLEVPCALGLHAVGDVDLDPDVVGDPPGLVDDRADHHLVPEGCAVAPVVADDRGHRSLLVQGGPDARDGDRVGVRTLQEPAVAAEDVLGRVAGEPGERAVHPDEGVVLPERVRDREREVAGEHRVQRQVVLPPDHLVVAAHEANRASVACTAGTPREAEP